MKLKIKQILAWAGIILLAALYIVTFFVAMFDNSNSSHLFAICLFATVVIPLLTWIYIWLYKKIAFKNSIDIDRNTIFKGENEVENTQENTSQDM